MKIIAVAQHPVPYQVPIYRHLASRYGDDFEALFSWPGFAAKNAVAGWGVTAKLDLPLLEGYRSRIVSTRNPHAVRAVVSDLLRSRPDALLLHNQNAPIARAALEISRLRGARIVLRSTPYDLRHASTTRMLARDAYLRWSYRRVHAFCAVGTLPRAHFIRYSGRPRDVFSSPYCTDEFYLAPFARNRPHLRESLRRQLGIPADARVLLVCSRISPEKRVDWSLRVHARAPLGTHLIVAGSGPLLPTIRSMSTSHGRIHFLGFCNRERVAHALAASDVLLLPSAHEPWGVVVNEAILFGLLVVASDVVASAVDLVYHGITGFVFPSHDEEAFARRAHDALVLSSRPRSSAVYDDLNRRFSSLEAAQGVVDAIDGNRP